MGAQQVEDAIRALWEALPPEYRTDTLFGPLNALADRFKGGWKVVAHDGQPGVGTHVADGCAAGDEGKHFWRMIDSHRGKALVVAACWRSRRLYVAEVSLK